MEIFHVFGIHWKLLAAQMVNFSIALFVLHRYVYKPIFAILEKRQSVITKGLQDAEDAKVEIARVAEASEQLMRKAREDGGKLVDTLHKEGVAEERRIVREAQDRAVALMSEARVKADEERAHLLRESEKEIAKMAILSAEKILRAKVGGA